jgi:hypothetical protein
VIKVIDETPQELSCSRPIIGMHLEPGIDEWSNQPSPNGALMVSRIARSQVTKVARFLVGMAGRK